MKNKFFNQTNLLRVFIILGVLYFAHNAMAATETISRKICSDETTISGSGERDLSSVNGDAKGATHTEVYKINDGYGEYSGQGKTKIQAQSGAREACVMAKVNLYESRHGATPDPDTADLIIDSCINK